MPFALSALVSGRFPPANSNGQRKLYFSPGGHTHDHHTIPPDQLHVSLSDPVLVAAEERLSAIIQDASTEKSTDPGSVTFHLKAGVLARDSTPAGHQGGSDRFWKAGFQESATQIPNLLDPSDDFDIAEVLTIMIDGSPGSTSDDSRFGPDLAPLASETFKEELYIRGYLKRPANIVPRKPRAGLVLTSRKVFPKVLGRRQGRKVAERLKVVQGAAETPGGPNAHLSEKHSATTTPNSGTLQGSHAGSLESPGTDANTSATSFDLHEFSYITAFTTPPSSPSDVETFKKGVTFGDGKHAA